jgi:hypothetical protein
VPPEEARYAALRKFGNITRAREETREVWSSTWLEQLLQDIRFGVRTLRKNPGFTILAVLTIALGIGANTAMFSVMQGVVLAPLRFFEPDRLVTVWENNPRFPRVWVSYLNFLDRQRMARSFKQINAGRSGHTIVGVAPVWVSFRRRPRCLYRWDKKIHCS